MTEAALPLSTSQKPKRQRLFSFPLSHWLSETSATPLTTDINAPALPSPPETTGIPDSLSFVVPEVSDQFTCSICGLQFQNLEEQRAHFKTDWHKCNVKRVARGRNIVTESQFDEMSDLGSQSSLSGSEQSEDDDDHGDEQSSDNPSLRTAHRVQFVSNKSFYILYKAALPDLTTLSSLSTRATWAVIMAGGGHFCAAIWDVKGNLMKHKTFHRYTSRRKQGGSQAAADASRGNASRIRSAGATLRRYGEQALQNDVRELLEQWKSELNAAQCIFVRASTREKRDLLYGWHGSPLKIPFDEGRIRNIPIPTRRATLKEATRVYEELSTVTISPVSLLESDVQRRSEPKQTSDASSTSKPSGPKEEKKEKDKEKGTAHLKNRDEKQRRVLKEPDKTESEEAETSQTQEPIDLEKERLLHLVINGDRPSLTSLFKRDPDAINTSFSQMYLQGSKNERVTGLRRAGLVTVAAAVTDVDLVVWLMENGADPAVGGEPQTYMATKNKAVRLALRKFWGANPSRFDYAAAGIPHPMFEQEIKAAADKERDRRRKEKAKKKVRALDKADSSKTPEQRARELRAAAAEARLLGNKCANCKKILDSMSCPSPVVHGALKYCRSECMVQHRRSLNS